MVLHRQYPRACKPRACALAILSSFAIINTPIAVHAGECPTSASEIATDRPDVTNSSLVVPVGSLQSENGINTTGRGFEKTFDGTNSRLRLGVAPCLEILVDLPNYVGKLKGDAESGFANVAPAVKWQFGFLPEQWNLSVTAGAGLPTGSAKIAGPGLQPYLQFPWSHELGGGWGTSGMITTFFFPSDPSNRQTTEVTFVLEKKVTERAALFVEYVGDYPARGSSINLVNAGGEYLLTKTQQIDFHIAFGLNRNSPNYIIGVGYSFRLDGLFGASALR
jgi:Putative MetA-pathway of phenol degradation